ncbi:MAG: sulfatase-like hydrolase/transferase, partial [Planctomycetota bacterium]
DAVSIFNYLFLGGAVIPGPFPDCGRDITPDPITCRDFSECNSGPPPEGRPNVLFIIVDDLGVDSMDGYTENAPSMPNIKALCESGVRFTNAWSAPVCSPTRATILTGRYGFRTGVGAPGDAIALDETTLPQTLAASAPLPYAQACIGKWHLSNDTNGGEDNPNLMGFPYYSGSLGGGVRSYTRWQETVNGSTAVNRDYITSVLVDDALDWIGDQDEPWFLWLAFNAPHSPFHLPPAELHSRDDLSGTEEDIEANPRPYYEAMLESLDHEIGRLLSSLPENVRRETDIIFLGDNGTPGQVAPQERGRAKDSLYQGGIHVPLIIAGPSVDSGGRTVQAVVNSSDLFATILDLAGVDIASTLDGTFAEDSISFANLLRDPNATPARPWAYAELFGEEAMANRRGRTVTDGRFKLIDPDVGGNLLFDLVDDPQESRNLLDSPLSDDASAALSELETALDEVGS